MQILRGNILTTDGWHHGQVGFATRIVDLQAQATDPANNSDDYIIPGFIDLHVHGAGGRDIMEGGDALQTITRVHAKHGTTGLLATTMTAPVQEIEHALRGVQAHVATPVIGGSRILGVHLEGPYINRGKLGAQPDFAHQAILSEIDGFHSLAPLRVLTLAPEVEGNMRLIADLVARGIRVQLGHTLASYEQSVEALQQGAVSFTHLFNAMSALQHREPGAVGAALAHAEYAELIPDLIHVHPGAIRAAMRAIPKLYCVTDATAAAGMPDGEYKLGRHTVSKCMGGVRLADGTLAGSTLTLDEALRNLVKIGLDIADASQRLSTFQADMLGLPDRGRLTLGTWADIVVLDRNLQIKAVYIEGEAVSLN